MQSTRTKSTPTHVISYPSTIKCTKYTKECTIELYDTIVCI